MSDGYYYRVVYLTKEKDLCEGSGYSTPEQALDRFDLMYFDHHGIHVFPDKEWFPVELCPFSIGEFAHIHPFDRFVCLRIKIEWGPDRTVAIITAIREEPVRDA